MIRLGVTLVVSHLGWSVFPERAMLGACEPLKGELTAPPVIHWEGVCGCGLGQRSALRHLRLELLLILAIGSKTFS